MRRLARLKPRVDRIVEGQLDETERLGGRRAAGRPGPDVRVPDAVPGDLRAAGAAGTRSGRSSARWPGPLRRHRRRHRHLGAVGGSRAVPARGDRPPAARPRRRADRPDHPRARRRDRRLRPRPGWPTARSRAASRPAPRCSRWARRCCSQPTPETAWHRRATPASTPIVEELLRYLDRRADLVPAVRQAGHGARRPTHPQGRRRPVPTCRPPTATRARRTATSPRPRPRDAPRTSPSGTASTAASVPSWRGWSCARPTPPWPAASRDLAAGRRRRRAGRSASCPSSTASSRCRSTSTAGCVRPG